MDYQRLKELADRSYTNGTFTFTDFCSMSELSAYYEKEKELRYASPLLFGGCDIAERKMIRFGNPDDLGYEQAFPITTLKIEPLAAKFADDLSHRDFLGALMNLGIRRELLGDIFVKEKAAIVFCKENIVDYIIENLTRIKHTSVKVSIATEQDNMIIAPTLEDRIIRVPSLRIDAVISKVYNLSRNDSVSLFSSGLVFLNDRECTENAKSLKPDDIISVRGHGRFTFTEELGISKKGKQNCRVLIYK